MAAPFQERSAIVSNRQDRGLSFLRPAGRSRLVYGELVIKNPYITIAGQTAPSPGIVVRGQAIIVDTHDVVIQHIRVRVGAVAWEPHSLWLRDGVHNVVVDHVSLSWAVWTSFGIVTTQVGGSRGEVSVLDSIVSESLACSGVNRAVPCNPASYPGSGYSNSRGMLIRESGGVSLLRNILAHNNDRNPETGGLTQTILVNNMIYNPSLAPLSAVLFSDPWHQGPMQSVGTGQHPGGRTDNAWEQRGPRSRVSGSGGGSVGARRPVGTSPVQYLPRWKLL